MSILLLFVIQQSRAEQSRSNFRRSSLTSTHFLQLSISLMASASCSPALTLTLSRPRAQIPHNRSPFPARWHPISAFHSRTKQDFRARTAPLRFRALCLREQKAAVVTGDSWEKSVLKSEIPVLVEFYASWCGPCRMVHRLIDEIAMEYAGRLKCCVVNTDNDLELAEDQDIKAVPVVLLFKNGKKCSSIVGTMPKEFYVAAVDKALL